MESQQISQILIMVGDKLPAGSFPAVRNILLQDNVDYDQVALACTQLKNPTTTLLLSIFFGYLGIDRFYIGDIGLGVGKLITFLMCGIGLIWWIVDLFLIMEETKRKNLQKFMMCVTNDPVYQY